jgi:hypothetical protein
MRFPWSKPKSYRVPAHYDRLPASSYDPQPFFRIHYVTEAPKGLIYQNRYNKTIWSPVVINDDEIVTALEVPPSGRWSYEVVDGVQEVFPGGAPKIVLPLDVFLADFELLTDSGE